MRHRRPDETITYTQWLNQSGLLEADVTVAKLAERPRLGSGGGGGGFVVTVTDTMHRHAEMWMRRHAEEAGKAVVITDVTGGYAQLNVHGQ